MCCLISTPIDGLSLFQSIQIMFDITSIRFHVVIYKMQQSCSVLCSFLSNSATKHRNSGVEIAYPNQINISQTNLHCWLCRTKWSQAIQIQRYLRIDIYKELALFKLLVLLFVINRRLIHLNPNSNQYILVTSRTLQEL